MRSLAPLAGLLALYVLPAVALVSALAVLCGTSIAASALIRAVLAVFCGGKRDPAAYCPCGCGCHLRDVPALPRDGIPLDDYLNRKLASVIAGFRSPDALVPESSDERQGGAP